MKCINQKVQTYVHAYAIYVQKDWAEQLIFVQIAIDNRDTMHNMSLFFLTHEYHMDLIQLRKKDLQAATGSRQGNGEAFVAKMKEAADWALTAMASAHQRMEDQANRLRQAADEFRIGDKVWLDLHNVQTTRPSKKFDWLYRKYTIMRVIDGHAYELDVPHGIHAVFHVDLLRRAVTDPLPSQVRDDVQPPEIVNKDGDEEYVVEEILCARTYRGERQALVKWAGWARPDWTSVDELQEIAALDD